MALVPPIIAAALADRTLTPGQTRVFLAAAAHLDFVELRPLKLVVLEHEIGSNMATISRALSVLVESRYLLRQRTRSGADPGWVYRLPFSRELEQEPDERAG